MFVGHTLAFELVVWPVIALVVHPLLFHIDKTLVHIKDKQKYVICRMRAVPPFDPWACFLESWITLSQAGLKITAGQWLDKMTVQNNF